MTNIGYERHLLETLPSDQYRESSDQEGVGEAMGDQTCSLISASFQICCCFPFPADFTCLLLFCISFDPFEEVGGTSRLPIIAAFRGNETETGILD